MAKHWEIYVQTCRNLTLPHLEIGEYRDVPLDNSNRVGENV